MTATKQVIFKVGQEDYGFDILLVNAIENYSGVVTIPNAPDYILGMVNLRGEIIPVFSLRKKFGLPEVPVDDKTQLIVTRTNNMAIGFKVDAVQEISEIDSEELHDMPVIVKDDRTKYAKCVSTKSGRLIILIDHDGVITEEEHAIAGKLLDIHSNQK